MQFVTEACTLSDARGKHSFSMREILRNIHFIGGWDPDSARVSANLFTRGSTMGSQKDLEDATDFITKNKIAPVISHVVDGLDSIEKGFEILEKGEQFGKVVVKIQPSPLTRL